MAWIKTVFSRKRVKTFRKQNRLAATFTAIQRNGNWIESTFLWHALARKMENIAESALATVPKSIWIAITASLCLIYRQQSQNDSN